MHTRLSKRLVVSVDDRATCRSLIRTGSRSFFAASMLLPAAIREAAYALYGFCRLSDDLVDEDGGSSEAIAQLRRRLDLAYGGRPANGSIDRAFADVVARYDLPRALPEALIDGLEWDVRGVTCETLSDLYAYSACVAGSVGAMMTVLMGVRDAWTVARACDLGLAMQLTNIARDVGEDARAGRLYLPRAWMRDAGLDADAWLAAPAFGPAIGTVVERLLETAEILYARADSGIGALPALCRPGIVAARHLYREIGIEVARQGYDSVSARARVSGSRKLGLVGRAVVDAVRHDVNALAVPPVPESAYLVDAVVASQARVARSAEPPLGKISHQILWVAELFATLDGSDRISEWR